MYVGVRRLLTQVVLQLEYFMTTFCLHQTLNSSGIPLREHFYNIPPITHSIIIVFKFDHLK